MMHPGLIAGAGAAGAIALTASMADRRRLRRSDPDAVGFMPWLLIQAVAATAAIVLAALATKV